MNPLSWGIQPPIGAVAAWGARAIYTRDRRAFDTNFTKAGKRRVRGRIPWFSIEMLYDRQSATGDEHKLKELIKWLDKTGLPKLRLDIEAEPGEDILWTFTDGPTDDQGMHKFGIVANPRSSHGYLYIGAYIR